MTAPEFQEGVREWAGTAPDLRGLGYYRWGVHTDVRPADRLVAWNGDPLRPDQSVGATVKRLPSLLVSWRMGRPDRHAATSRVSARKSGRLAARWVVGGTATIPRDPGVFASLRWNP